MAINTEPAPRTWYGPAVLLLLVLTSGCGVGNEPPVGVSLSSPPKVAAPPDKETRRGGSQLTPKPKVEVKKFDPSSLRLAPG